MKALKNKYLPALIVGLLFTIAGYAQAYTDVNAYGYNWQRGYFREGLRLPQKFNSIGDSTGAVKYNPADSTVYVNTGRQWIKMGGAGGLDTLLADLRYIRNQFNAAQSASLWISGSARFGGQVIFDKPLSMPIVSTNPATGTNGQTIYNGTTLDGMMWDNSGWKKILLEGDVGYVTGKVITVDKESGNATDSRGGLSKYNSFYPFKTISAAASVMADGDVLVVAAANYGSDSLIITNSAYTNAVYFDGVTMTGNIKMAGKIFTTNSVLNSVITFYYRGTDIPSGNLISGLDKGSTVINGRIETTSSPGAQFLTIRHLGRISTPASGSTAGHTFTSPSQVTIFIDGISKIENLSTTNVLSSLPQTGTLTVMNVGTITSEYNGNSQSMFYGNLAFRNVDEIIYKGTSTIAGGYSSNIRYAEATTFKSSTTTMGFTTYGGSAANLTFKACNFVFTAANSYIIKLTSGPTGGVNKTKNVYLYNCQLQCSNSSGANYPIQINNDDLNELHFTNCIGNQNTATMWVQNGAITATAPTINIVANYTYTNSFIIQQPPTFN